MNRLNYFIKTLLLTCVVIASQTYASNNAAWHDDKVSGALDGYNSAPPVAMVKIHKIVLDIVNNTSFKLSGPQDWFDSGRLGDHWAWSEDIPAFGGKSRVELYEKDNSLAGCSGYVNYNWNVGVITFAFSNPYFGSNKLGVGVGGKSVWDKMESHGYNEFTEYFTINGIKIKAVCQVSGGDVSSATVTLSSNEEPR